MLSSLASLLAFVGTCTLNGEIVPCEQLEPFLSFFFWVFPIVFILIIATGWRLFSKAGKPGWVVLVPIYNFIIELEIVGRPAWWIFLLIIPVVNIIVAIILANDLAKSFGKGTGYTVGLILLPFIFYPMLAFGGATYVGPAAAR